MRESYFFVPGKRKEPYIPSKSKRFEISTDPYSRERIKVLFSAYHELKESFPYFAGMTIFGSLTKGKELQLWTQNCSDIDLVGFIDYDRFKTTFATTLAPNPDFIELLERGRKEENVYLARNKQGDYDVEDPRLHRASEYFLEKYIEKFIDSKLGNTGVASAEVRMLAMEGDNSIMDYAQLHQDSLDYKLFFDYAYKMASLKHLANPFFLDIGGGIAPYRQAFIQQLQMLDQERSHMFWELAVGAMRYWERKDNIPVAIEHQYPSTVKEAQRKYSMRQ